MGYNSVALILNDALGDIERDPEFGKNVAGAVRGWYDRKRDRFATSVGARADLPNGGTSSCFPALEVISQDHADGEQVVIVHANSGQRCAEANHLGWHALDQMKACLERHGYTVTKKRKAKAVGDARG